MSRGSYVDFIREVGGKDGWFKGPDPFAVLGVHVDEELTCRGYRYHFRKYFMRHVFERAGGESLTMGPNIPTWAQINDALDKLTKNELMLPAIRKHWKHLGSVQVWNPRAEFASDEARRPPGGRVTCKCWMHGVPFHCLGAVVRVGRWSLGLHVDPADYYASVEEVVDESFRPTAGNHGFPPIPRIQ